MNNCSCDINRCDIFDFMANHVGLTVLHPGGYKATKILAEHCKINDQSYVLDLACGKGTSTNFLAQEFGCHVMGIDISEGLINQAIYYARKRKLSNKITFKVADALRLPFPDNTFDAVIAQAMLVLVDDQRKVIQEALRVVKQDGLAGWIELSWKKQPPGEFLDIVSNVICAYCMRNVSTFEGWEKIFHEAGVKQLNTLTFSMDFQGMLGMLRNEGFINSIRVMYKYVARKQLRNRINRMNKFFAENPDYFGYGIYITRK